MAIREIGLYDDFQPTESGLWLPGRLPKKHPTAIDLFCGAGGFSLGIMQAGFEVLAGVDNDAVSALTYMTHLCSYPVEIHYVEPGDKDRLNKAVEKYCMNEQSGVVRLHAAGSGWISHHPDTPPVRHFFFGDIRKLNGSEMLDVLGLEIGELDLVVGGPPCQGFSFSGKREVMDPRNSLVFEFARLVVEIQPKTVCMENVPGIVSMVTPEGIPVMDAFCRILEDGGFGCFDALKKTLLNTSGVGAALRGKGGKKKVEQTRVESAAEMQQQALF